MTKQKANPGGQIDPKNVIGRDKIIETIWDTLEQQSIRITAERRIGKTSIIKKMCAEPRPGWTPIFQDLEKFHSTSDFALGIYREVAQFLGKQSRMTRHANEILKNLGGIEIGGLIRLPKATKSIPWKDTLENTIRDLIEEQAKLDTKLLFLWDEVPFMLDNIKKREGEQAAMEVLDTLRGLRQSYAEKGLRMVITGSIGIHHVIKALKGEGYANSPLNDLFSITIDPLMPEHANTLAAQLFAGEMIDLPDTFHQATCDAVTQASDGFPFYIHHIIKALKIQGIQASPESIEDVVQDQMVDANDPWELAHYRDRLSTYYGENNESAALSILDSLAEPNESTGTSSVNELLQTLKNCDVVIERDKLVQLLRLMEQDHYLKRNAAGHYHFQFPLLKRWWRLSRGL